MKKVSRILTLVLALIITAGMAAGCGGKDNESVRIGVIMPSATHGFTGESIQHAEAELNALKATRGFESRFVQAAEATEQVSAIEDMLATWDPDVIVLWPIEGNALRNVAQQVVDAKVKLIIYDRLIEDFIPTAEIMGDNTAIGEMTGKYFNKFFADDIADEKTIMYLEFMGDSSTVPKQRSEGFLETIDDAFELASPAFSTDWQRETAMQQMEDWLNTSSKADIEALQAIFTHDDEVVLGVIDALKNYTGKAKLNVKLISGVSGRKENVELFADCGVSGLKQVTYEYSPSMIREAIRMGVNAAYGEQYGGKAVVGLFLIETFEIDEDSMEAYLASDTYAERYSID